MRPTRRFIAALCILIVLAGALLAPAAGGSAPGVLVPLPPLFGFVLLPPAPAADPAPVHASFDPAPLPSRAPPVA